MDHGGEKQGKNCCGCCCDFRRAVIVIAILGILKSSIFIVLAAIASGSGVYAGIFAIALCFSIFQLFAALKYNVCMLATVIVFNLIGLGYDLYYSITIYTGGPMAGAIVANIIFAAIWIYPTAGLLIEINNGIMSPETYPREAYSCCCQPKV